MTASSAPLKVLVVDDELHARTGLVRMLAERSDVTVVGEARDGSSAIRAIRETTPDLILLDVQMPPPDGFGVVRAIGPDRMPPVIFVTAYDQFAVQAFETHALDYLVKPYSERRLFQALDRARASQESRRLGVLAQRLLAAMAEPGAEPAARHDRIVVKSLGKTEIVPVDDVLRVDAAGYCVKLRTRTRTIVHRESMYALAARLPSRRFARVHRSTIVNLDHIREARVTPGGEHELVLRDGSRVAVSRTRWPAVDGLLREWRR